MIIEAACCCNTGRVRGNNEDNLFFNGFYLNKDNNGLEITKTGKFDVESDPLFCVFDGMGGEEAGEVASYIGAKSTGEYVAKEGKASLSTEGGSEEWCTHMNLAVFEGSRGISPGRMGSTYVSLFFSGKNAYISNVGDSSAFLITEGGLAKLSTDHVEKLPPSMQKHKARLTQCLGADPEELRVVPSTASHPLKKGDCYLLCSDGLTDMVSEESIMKTVHSHASTKKAAESLIDLALKNGGKDNVSVVLCKIK